MVEHLKCALNDLAAQNIRLFHKGSQKKSHSICPAWACIIKLFMDLFNPVVQSASAFAIVNHFLLALTNTLALYVPELATTVMSFIIHTPELQL
jgi:hypothetical protein